MASPQTSPSFLRISLLELLLLLAAVAVGCAALKYAGEVWWIVLSSALLVGFLAAAVVAVVGRGPGQARAIGFVLCVMIYMPLIWAAPLDTSRELDPHAGRLPTTKLLGAIFESIVSRKQVDMATGQPVANSNSGYSGAYPPTLGYSMTLTQESPDRGQFMAIGHLLWALLLGYLGSRLAVWVDGRRRQRAEPRLVAS
ncbi:MAG TPA: hypothetical protein VFV87_08040 [Pirellulaceae bacterium]|nr:hypothetical protein [Pirellulaceae bacterium]